MANQACGCQNQPAPRKPDYFWLSLWTDNPNPYPNDNAYYSQPNQLVWEYKATEYDEVLVGYDNYSQNFAPDFGHEAVYRYSVRIPRKYWFYQPGKEQVYWLSVVAVYYNLESAPYEWGWTNHPYVYNDTAVTTLFPASYPYGDSPQWSPLYDPTRAKEDMSFMLFTDPNEYQPVPVP